MCLIVFPVITSAPIAQGAAIVLGTLRSEFEYKIELIRVRLSNLIPVTSPEFSLLPCCLPLDEDTLETRLV